MANYNSTTRINLEINGEQATKILKSLGKDTEKLRKQLKQAEEAGDKVRIRQQTKDINANEALLMLLDTLKRYGGIESLASVFCDMGADGARMSATLAALAGNVEAVRSQQTEANKAFAEAVSVTAEFDVQNNTVQAGLDKARKRTMK